MSIFRTKRLASRTFALFVYTTIPSAAGVEQAVSSRLAPTTSTRHIRQLPSGVKSLKLHKVGMSIPTDRAALSIVVPVSTLTVWPSIVKLSIVYFSLRLEFHYNSKPLICH
jgi:hypothetical protein